eukprot:5628512-Pleurochrysis_carterae.AAC.1
MALTPPQGSEFTYYSRKRPSMRAQRIRVQAIASRLHPATPTPGKWSSKAARILFSACPASPPCPQNRAALGPASPLGIAAARFSAHRQAR